MRKIGHAIAALAPFIVELAGYDSERVGLGQNPETLEGMNPMCNINANQLGHHYDPKSSFIPKVEHRFGYDGFFAAYNFHHEYYSPKAY